MSASWSVITVMRNTPYEVMRFVAWYLDMGADQIYIIFHDENDPFIARLQGHPRITCIPFTADLRAQMGIDPDYAGPPQIQAGTYLYPRVTTDWVLRLDCDELVLCENGRLSERLAALPADIQTAIIRPCEQLISDLPAHHHLFRMRMTDEDAQQIYGDMAELLSKRRGLMSHAFGKSAHRTGIQNIEVREHNAVFIGTNTRTNNLAWMRKKGVSLLHFNAEVFEKWKAAAARRSRNASFAPALSAKILAAEASETADTELRQIYDTIVHFDTRRTDALLETDCGFVLDFDFDVLIDRYFDSAQLMLRAG